jgi:hypothetical protein
VGRVGNLLCGPATYLTKTLINNYQVTRSRNPEEYDMDVHTVFDCGSEMSQISWDGKVVMNMCWLSFCKHDQQSYDGCECFLKTTV